MLEKNLCPQGKEKPMSEEQARLLCRKLEKGGITRPDNCMAFLGRK